MSEFSSARKPFSSLKYSQADVPPNYESRRFAGPYLNNSTCYTGGNYYAGGNYPAGGNGFNSYYAGGPFFFS